jgi:hypothetical protein
MIVDEAHRLHEGVTDVLNRRLKMSTHQSLVAVQIPPALPQPGYPPKTTEPVAVVFELNEP